METELLARGAEEGAVGAEIIAESPVVTATVEAEGSRNSSPAGGGAGATAGIAMSSGDF